MSVNRYPVSAPSSADQSTQKIALDATRQINKLSDDVRATTDAHASSIASLDANLHLVPTYTVAALPTDGSINIAVCSNETGGATLVFRDGTNWRRVQDRAIAS